MQFFRCWGWALLWAGAWASGAAAASPWKNLLTINRVEADPEKSYELTEENGPWMIMAVTFTTETAEEDAQALVLELRRRFRLPAYIRSMELDFTGHETGRGYDKYGLPKTMKYNRSYKTTEVAVLVGNYQSVDDPAAQDDLRRVKYLRPECLQPAEGKRVSRPLAAFRHVQQAVLSDDNPKKRRGPMGHAFITANPLLPDDYYAPKGVDQFVLKLNKKVEHSLLDCAGRYSVQVAMFTGKAVQTQGQVDQDDLNDVTDRLAVAADRAHRMTAGLREQGYDAYEFHDRYCSIVCIGSFDSIGTQLPDGQTELDPRILKIMQKFGATQQAAPGQPASSSRQKFLKDTQGEIPFDLQPLPVETPRRAISADYDRSARR